MKTSRCQYLLKTLPNLLLPILLIGCASGRQALVEKADWDGRLGSYTYEQALAELGNPSVLIQASDGTTGEWIVRRSPDITFGFGVGTGSYGHHSGASVGVGTSVSPPPSGEYLRLKFDKESRLADWSRIRY